MCQCLCVLSPSARMRHSDSDPYNDKRMLWDSDSCVVNTYIRTSFWILKVGYKAVRHSTIKICWLMHISSSIQNEYLPFHTKWESGAMRIITVCHQSFTEQNVCICVLWKNYNPLTAGVLTKHACSEIGAENFYRKLTTKHFSLLGT